MNNEKHDDETMDADLDEDLLPPMDVEDDQDPQYPKEPEDEEPDMEDMDLDDSPKSFLREKLGGRKVFIRSAVAAVTFVAAGMAYVLLVDNDEASFGSEQDIAQAIAPKSKSSQMTNELLVEMTDELDSTNQEGAAAFMSDLDIESAKRLDATIPSVQASSVTESTKEAIQAGVEVIPEPAKEVEQDPVDEAGSGVKTEMLAPANENPVIAVSPAVAIQGVSQEAYNELQEKMIAQSAAWSAERQILLDDFEAERAELRKEKSALEKVVNRLRSKIFRMSDFLSKHDVIGYSVKGLVLRHRDSNTVKMVAIGDIVEGYIIKKVHPKSRIVYTQKGRYSLPTL